MKKHNIFIMLVYFLVLVGIVMVYSASAVWAEFKTGNDKYYLIRQLMYALIGSVVFIIGYRYDYRKWKKHSSKLLLISTFLLIIVLIPGIGLQKNGARSWIGIGELSFQPSEFIKITYIIFLASKLSEKPGELKKLNILLKHIAITVFIFVLILLQPDFGTGVIFLMTIFFILFISLMKYKYVIMGMCSGIISFIIMIIIAPYRLTRIFSFLNPWSDPLGSGFQIIQSLYAISPASLFGYGLFNSRQKYFYLPEPQNDFIFAILCEELGIIGGALIIIVFASIIYFGYNLALKTKDLFACYLSFGFITLLMIQVFINIAVVIGVIPVTGETPKNVTNSLSFRII